MQDLDCTVKVPVPGGHVGITGMHVEVALGFAEGHSRQFAGLGIGDKPVGSRFAPQAIVTQALAALERVLRTLLHEVVERLVVVLEVWNLR